MNMILFLKMYCQTILDEDYVKIWRYLFGGHPMNYKYTSVILGPDFVSSISK